MSWNEYTRKLEWWEAVFSLAVVGLLVWALAKGSGPLLLAWGLGLFAVVSVLRFLLSLWRLLFT